MGRNESKNNQKKPLKLPMLSHQNMGITFKSLLWGLPLFCFEASGALCLPRLPDPPTGGPCVKVGPECAVSKPPSCSVQFPHYTFFSVSRKCPLSGGIFDFLTQPWVQTNIQPTAFHVSHVFTSFYSAQNLPRGPYKFFCQNQISSSCADLVSPSLIFNFHNNSSGELKVRHTPGKSLQIHLLISK
jgi:hypothetical protein